MQASSVDVTREGSEKRTPHEVSNKCGEKKNKKKEKQHTVIMIVFIGKSKFQSNKVINQKDIYHKEKVSILKHQQQNTNEFLLLCKLNNI